MQKGMDKELVFLVGQDGEIVKVPIKCVECSDKELAEDAIEAMYPILNNESCDIYELDEEEKREMLSGIIMGGENWDLTEDIIEKMKKNPSKVKIFRATCFDPPVEIIIYK